MTFNFIVQAFANSTETINRESHAYQAQVPDIKNNSMETKTDKDNVKLSQMYKKKLNKRIKVKKSK